MKNNILNEYIVRQKQDTIEKNPASEKYVGTHRTGLQHILCCGVSLRHITYTAIMLVTAVCAGIPNGHAQTAKPQYGVSVAVLPFEVFSIEKEPTLGDEVAELITKHLALNPSIVCVNNQQVKTVMQADEYGAMTEVRLRQLAKLLNANCIIMGTVTKIRAEHSIDVEMYNTSSPGPNFKTFSEGLEIKTLVETIALVIDQEIMEKAEQIPTAERPRVSAARQSTPQTPTGGFNVDRALLAAFGPMKESPPQSAGTSTPTTADIKPVAPALTEETILDEPEASALPDSQPSIALTEDLVIAQKDAPPTRLKASSKNKKDSGFFSLSKAISINSDTMEYDNRANKGIFKGNVVARQNDIVMFANSMHVYYSDGGGLSRVDAHGNVRVVQGDRIATGNSIIFNNATQTIVATGSPRVWQGDNVVHGTKITVYLKEERTVVESDSNSRASATIYPNSNKKQP